jgi:hypothetical protein
METENIQKKRATDSLSPFSDAIFSLIFFSMTYLPKSWRKITQIFYRFYFYLLTFINIYNASRIFDVLDAVISIVRIFPDITGLG